MLYETNLIRLRGYTEDDWEETLTRLQNDPSPPRGIVRVRPSPSTCDVAARREDILARLAAGERGCRIAEDYGVSVSYISKVKKGER